MIVAATAAEHGPTVLHYDSDYERLSEVTGAAHEWVAPRGEGHGRQGCSRKASSASTRR
ncbi:hypothetical protein ACU610_19520 [Geodermatophilus sp. URMC 61]|uniref:hypothetical protein n=1 Tax=Geodermatophilus sp. URMC 61 TaxID=3423411 RepID=UPI00406D1BCC